MDFDKSRVYTAVNADELKDGSKVYVADSIDTLKRYVEDGLDTSTISELEEKISVLLSCKDCPDNKGGYICQKEYEDKCLAQKIQYIKELKEENKELKVKYDTCLRENTGLKIHSAYVEKKLPEAKELIRTLLRVTYGEGWNYSLDVKVKAEQFLKGCE